MLNEEVLAKALQCLLYAFMAGRVRQLEDHRQGSRGGGHEHAGAAQYQPIDDAPVIL